MSAPTTARCVVCARGTSPCRYRCHTCTERERALLREIETYYAMLPSLLVPTVASTERRAPGFGSAAPLDLNVLVALDTRSTLLADRMADGAYLADPEVDDDEPGRSILADLESLARVRREDFDQRQPTTPATVCSEIAYLLGAAEQCSFHPWVDEHFSTIQDVHSYARSLARDKPPGPIGQCLQVDCDGVVFWCRDVIIKGEAFDCGRCATCGSEHYGARLLRVKVKEVTKVSMRVVREVPNGATLWHLDPNRGFGWTCPCGSTAQTAGRIGECQAAYDSHFLWVHFWPMLCSTEAA